MLAVVRRPPDRDRVPVGRTTRSVDRGAPQQRRRAMNSAHRHSDVRAAFEAGHKRLFGFIEAKLPIVIAAVEVEAVSAATSPSPRWREGGVRVASPSDATQSLPRHGATESPPSPSPLPLKGERDLDSRRRLRRNRDDT